MSLLNQRQDVSTHVIIWDGQHRGVDGDLLVDADRIPEKRLGILTGPELDVLGPFGRRRLCPCGFRFVTGNRRLCWRCCKIRVADR